MIITKTPVRISFLGGGTDYPEYFEKHEGSVLVTTIDKYSYLSVKPLNDFFDYNIRISYTKTELVNNVEEIAHPSVRECLKFLKIYKGIEINYVGDLPARTGLGSSSSFTVGLLHALHAFKGEMVSKQQLAEEAVIIEREMIKERIGLQDQYASAFGGLLLLKFFGRNQVDVCPIAICPERRKMFNERLMLFYTGISRTAHEILKEQIEKTEDNHSKLIALNALVERGIKILCNNDKNLSEFGELLDEGWRIKKQLSVKISNEEIDRNYNLAKKVGAVGGKLLGAGGGGFLLLYVEQDKKNKVRRALSNLKEVEFRFENEGSRIIFYSR